mgnify:CR=1 FL=1
MANRDCNGDFYEINGSRWYRCLWDSTVIPAANCEGGSCPHCERRIEATDHGQVKTREFLVTDAFYGGRWFEHSTANASPVSEKAQ